VIDPEVLASKKPTGREKDAITYSAVGYVAFLSIISESSPPWQAVY
jgi:hypothetical protein